MINGLEKTYKACMDDLEAPRDSEPYMIKRPLYFAKESRTWDQHGVAFISNEEDAENYTYGRLYLISRKQFEHLFAVENGRRGIVAIDYDVINAQKFQDFNYNFYNRIIQLEDNYKGYPVLTFTNKKNLHSNHPMPDYLELIKAGIKEVYQVEDIEFVLYFKRAGVEG